MKKIILILAIVGIALTACQQYKKDEIPPTLTEIRPTRAIPSKVPIIATSTPTQNLILTKEPVEFSGHGDDVIELKGIWTGPAIIHATHDGMNNFIIEVFDAYGNSLDLLINTIGKYDGLRLINFIYKENVALVTVKADGNWTFTVQPFSRSFIHDSYLLKPYEGHGDDIVSVYGNKIVHFTCRVRKFHCIRVLCVTKSISVG
jgi:hypothetical protein